MSGIPNRISKGGTNVTRLEKDLRENPGGVHSCCHARRGGRQLGATQPPAGRQIGDRPLARRLQTLSKWRRAPKEAPIERPEQKKTAHDLSDVFNPSNAEPSSEALTHQQDRGEMLGFDFYRDPLGAMKPGMTFEDFYKAGVANKPKVMATQRKLLESRYNLEPKLDPIVKMSRGKPIAVGPTAKLPAGMTWEALAELSPAEIRERDIFPYKALPHVAQGGGLGGQVFPQMQIKMFPRLERYDVEFDLPEAFLPEFPPAMFLQNRPELGDVSRGEVVSINNYYRLFKDILTARAARWPAFAGDAIPSRRVQPDRRSKDCSAQLGSDVPGLSCEWPHQRSVPHHSRHTGPSSGASDWTPSVCAACSINTFTGRSGAYGRSRTLPSLSSAPLTSMAMRFTRSRKA